jgi:hypothetical protein
MLGLQVLILFAFSFNRNELNEDSLVGGGIGRGHADGDDME